MSFTKDALNLYIDGNNPIPTKPELAPDVFVDKKKISTVIYDGNIGLLASSDVMENRQELKFKVPALYEGVDIRDMIQKITNAAGKKGVTMTFKTKDNKEKYRYRNCFVTAGGTMEDDGGRFIEYTFTGIQIVAGGI